jgi:hypothetical protein
LHPGFIKNIQVPAAERLGETGPQVAPYGTIRARKNLIAIPNAPEANEAAKRALQKVNGC